MERAVIVKGRITDDRHIELDESLSEMTGAVEVTLRPVPQGRQDETEDILDFIAGLPGGTRTKEDIDQQVREERDSWKRSWDED